MSQSLTAYVNASYLVAHTFAGILGDFLLNKKICTTEGLMYISATSVGIAFCIALFFKPVDSNEPINLKNPFRLIKSVYGTKKFWVVTLWYIMMYSAYNLCYQYEISIFTTFIKKKNSPYANYNGTLTAVALLFGALSAFLLSIDAVQKVSTKNVFVTFFVMGIILGVSQATMGWDPTSYWLVLIGFSVFMCAWSFSNALYYGEIRRVVNEATQSVEDNFNTPSSEF